MKKINMLLVLLGVLFLVNSVSGYQIIDQSEKVLIFHKDGTFLDITPSQLEAFPLEAGDEVSDDGYILIQNDAGGWEYVPASATENYFLETVSKAYSTEAECQSKCSSYANSYCSTGSLDAHCEGKYCKYNCRGTSCKAASDCSIGTAACDYCRLSPFTCSSGKCSGGTCGTATQCGGGCTSDADAKDDCLKQYAGSSKYVISARCSKPSGSTYGQPICVTGSVCRTECSSATDPVCKTKAAAACTYGYTGGTCNMERDCAGNLKCATCTWQCNSPPTTQICGDGKCTGTETCSSCSKDCGSCTTCTKVTGTAEGKFCGTSTSTNPCRNYICAAGLSCVRSICAKSECTTVSGTPEGKFCGLSTSTTPCRNYVCADGLTCQSGVCKPQVIGGSTCGNNRCDLTGGLVAPFTGDILTCPSECPQQFCGNSKCDTWENERSCSYDCSNTNIACSNGVCEPGEDCSNCQIDCGACDSGGGDSGGGGGGGDVPSCEQGAVGAMRCEGKDLVQDSQSATCEIFTDIVTPCDIACVDGACLLIPPEIPDVCGDGTCGSTENRALCPDDCTIVICGDGTCSPTETAALCSSDCKGGGGGGGGGVSTGGIDIVIPIILLAAFGGLAFYFIKIKKPSQVG